MTINGLDAVDTDDSGSIDITDGHLVNVHLFLGAFSTPEPGPMRCLGDPTEDPLGCRVSKFANITLLEKRSENSYQDGADDTPGIESGLLLPARHRDSRFRHVGACGLSAIAARDSLPWNEPSPVLERDQPGAIEISPPPDERP